MWEVEFTDEFEAWWQTLSVDEQAAVEVRVNLLESEGPSLKRPVVGAISNSRHANMKELVVSSGSADIRILFMFDPRRTAILLLGGDKAEHGWNAWYPAAIAKAERLYDEHLAALQEEGELEDG